MVACKLCQQTEMGTAKLQTAHAPPHIRPIWKKWEKSITSNMDIRLGPA